MKDDKKITRKAIAAEEGEWAAKFEEAIAEPDPAVEAATPVGTHFDNLKKTRRAGKP